MKNFEIETKIEPNSMHDSYFHYIEFEDGDDLYELFCRLSHKVNSFDDKGFPNGITEIIYLKDAYRNDERMDLWDALSFVEKNKDLVREELANTYLNDF